MPLSKLLQLNLEFSSLETEVAQERTAERTGQGQGGGGPLGCMVDKFF